MKETFTMSYSQEISKLMRRLGSLIPNLGLSQTFVYFIQRLRYSFFNKTKTEHYTLISKNSQFPLFCRPNTSHISVFTQIFIEREYSCLDDLSNVDLIIDCGANVGYSSAYFLTRFPKAKVICVEPDMSNFMMLEKNLAPYKERVKLIRSGLWSHPTGLKILETPYRDTREWTVQVRECQSGEVPEIQAIDVGSLLRESGLDRISILKMDIEGAEAVVFTKNYESWLTSVDNMVIELHDDSSFGKASDIVLNAISACKSFSMSTSGELTVCKAIPLPS
jgi:FkbM family methyltransferase